jgi:hypothetical protein
VTSPFCNTEGLAIVLAAAAFHSTQLHQHCVELRSGAVAELAVKRGCDVKPVVLATCAPRCIHISFACHAFSPYLCAVARFCVATGFWQRVLPKLRQVVYCRRVLHVIDSRHHLCYSSCYVVTTTLLDVLADGCVMCASCAALHKMCCLAVILSGFWVLVCACTMCAAVLCEGARGVAC